MIPISTYANFESASSEVLNYLHSQLGFNLWMVTRTQSNDWIVLNAKDHGYNVKKGDVFHWTDSFCSRMVEGQGPRIAPQSDDIPAYADAPIGHQVDIGAYIGVPLVRENGELFGTLCAIDPESQPQEITAHLPLVEMMARLLTTILENELKAESEHRRAEHALAKAMTDGLTGLYNRRGWKELLAKEEARCKRHGQSAALLSIDLDNLKIVNDKFGHMRGDELLTKAAQTLSGVTRTSDVVARTGGDEFAILAVDCDLPGAERLRSRLEAAFEDQGTSASIGMAMLEAGGTLTEAFDNADRLMYAQKSQRKILSKS